MLMLVTLIVNDSCGRRDECAIALVAVVKYSVPGRLLENDGIVAVRYEAVGDHTFTEFAVENGSSDIVSDIGVH